MCRGGPKADVILCHKHMHCGMTTSSPLTALTLLLVLPAQARHLPHLGQQQGLCQVGVRQDSHE